MSSRRGDSQGGVLSFTYLDVLVCTMGSLVLMLVMFAERAKRAALVEAEKPQPPAVAAESPQPVDSEDLTRQLAEVRQRQAELERARAQAQEQLDDEQQRLTHLEEHQRRFEHELAKLHLTLKQLEAAENQQVVDQDQATKELERLCQLIKDTEARLADMRKEGAGERSYAIVPYKGPNGTFRRPVYVECTREAIIVQPEGIRLTADDFGRPLGSGNPLAAAIRAAQEELNARARAAGVTELPDPYPLFIVRPDGIKAYEVALAATRTWDSDYGYEFIDADWKLAYQEADPRLAQVMTHAIDTARERQRLLAMAAPSRYGTRLTSAGGGGQGRGLGAGGSGRGGGDSVQQTAGYDSASGSQSTVDPLQAIGDVTINSGNAMTAGGGKRSTTTFNGDRYVNHGQGAVAAQAGNFADQFPPTGNQDGAQGSAANAPLGAYAANGSATGTPGASAGNPGGPSAGGQPAPDASRPTNGFATSGAQYSPTTGAQSPGQFDPHAATSAASQASAANSAGSGQRGTSTTNAPSSASFDSKSESAAESRGVNWANRAANRRAAPITRPIHVIIRPDQLTLVDANATPDAASMQGKVVSFQQPYERVLDQLAAAIREQTRDWGLAGHGMYWRPTLVFQVAPGADSHAQRLAELMQDSGVDVRLPNGTQTAARPEDSSRATR